jgi:hypothetical protein
MSFPRPLKANPPARTITILSPMYETGGVAGICQAPRRAGLETVMSARRKADISAVSAGTRLGSWRRRHRSRLPSRTTSRAAGLPAASRHAQRPPTATDAGSRVDRVYPKGHIKSRRPEAHPGSSVRRGAYACRTVGRPARPGPANRIAEATSATRYGTARTYSYFGRYAYPSRQGGHEPRNR